MASIFTKIVNGEIPSYRIAEDDRHYAFLDINPLAEGHTLVIPKQEEDYLFDLTPDALAALMQFTQRVALAIGRTMPCKRVGVVVLGLEVPHAHIHLVPLNTEADVDFGKPKLQLTPERMGQIAQTIAAELK
ncbi:MAG: HIT family protein [Bacteroidales bacterium]|nr:HIT family protein [Bacteroidales bacterium]